MFHNTMQANATQMAPGARGTAVSLFAAALFMGQSLGALLAANLIDRIGSTAVIALGGGVVLLLGVFCARLAPARATSGSNMNSRSGLRGRHAQGHGRFILSHAGGVPGSRAGSQN